MKITSTNNLLQRYLWLKEIRDNEIKPSKSQLDSIGDMRAFCSLSVDNRFEKISYNTLKTCCLIEGIPGVSLPPFSDSWSHFKSLRSEAYSNAFSLHFIENDTPKLDYKAIEKQALLLAHLSSTAYLELFRFIKTLIESDNALADATKIKISNFLLQSTTKFESVISQTTVLESSAKWQVIEGGKP